MEEIKEELLHSLMRQQHFLLILRDDCIISNAEYNYKVTPLKKRIRELRKELNY